MKMITAAVMLSRHRLLRVAYRLGARYSTESIRLPAPRQTSPRSRPPQSPPPPPPPPATSSPEEVAARAAALRAAVAASDAKAAAFVRRQRLKNNLLATALAAFVVWSYINSVRAVRKAADSLSGSDMAAIQQELAEEAKEAI